MSDPFLRQLSDLCASHVTRCKWVFVPAHGIGWTIGERIVREGTNWLNLRFVTPLDIALRMGAPFLVERGIEPSEDGLGPALMMRLLLDLPKEDGYFQPLAQHPTLAQAMWSTVRELRMAGVRSKDMKRDAFESKAKHAELVALFAAYEQFLAANQRADLATVYEEALKHQDWCPIQPQDCWTELPDTQWTPLQQALIDAMPGERILPKTLGLPGVHLPRRLQSRLAERREMAVRVPPDPAKSSLAFLMTPTAGKPPKQQIALFHAGGREAEIEEVFRRIVALGVSLDQVEISCASDAHVELIWEKALRHEWLVTLGPGIPAAFTRPGRALIGLCDWIETDFSAGHFRRLLQSGDLGIGEGIEEDTEGFTVSQAARLLGRAGAGWGRRTYALSLGRLLKEYESRAGDPDESDEDRAIAQAKADQVKRVRDWLMKLVDGIPQPATDGTVPLQVVVTAVLAFLERTTARSSALDHRAADALRDYIGDLRALGSFACGLPESLRFVRERVQSLTVAPERPRPGHLYVSRLSQSGYAGRPHLFVVGLEEGRVFSSSTEDAILLDAERAAISPHLRLSADRIDEAVYGVLSRLATVGSSDSAVPPAQPARPARPAPTITFSFSCRDTREFRETYASWLVLQAYRLQQGDEAPSYIEMRAALGEPKSAIPDPREAALSPGAWWLRTVVGSGEAGTQVVGSAFAPLARGRIADAQRQSAAFTEFDGYVPAAGSVLDPCAPGTTLSVTELEKAAQCSFRFFLKRGLGIRPPDDRDRDKDVWLDPLTRGSELHDLYAAMLRKCRDEKRRPGKKDGEWLLARAKARLQQLHEEMPAATAEILDRESRDFLADVKLFADAEYEEDAATPIGLEVGFGRPLDSDDKEPLAREAPVEVNLGDGLTFRIAGRIDRIDHIDPPGVIWFQVLDYKTGGYWRDNWAGTFDGGQRLQHALYGLAAVELLKTKHKNPKVVRGVYYFSSHKGQQERVVIPTPSLAATTAVLADLRDLILNGQFLRTSDKGSCTFCDYAAACGEDVVRQAGEKVNDATLEARRRLAEHA